MLFYVMKLAITQQAQQHSFVDILGPFSTNLSVNPYRVVVKAIVFHPLRSLILWFRCQQSVAWGYD